MKAVVIGRSNRCDFVYNDPYVSRKHLQIVKKSENEFFVIDLNSSTGTYINGEKIPPFQEIAIDKNDIIKIGNTLLKWNDFFKEKPVKTPDMYTTTPDKSSELQQLGNENKTLPEEIMYLIGKIAKKRITPPSSEDSQKLMEMSKVHKLEYDTQVVPILNEQIETEKKQYNEKLKLEKVQKKPESIINTPSTKVKEEIQDKKQENKKTDVKYANFGQRLVAYLIDSIIMSLIVWGIPVLRSRLCWEQGLFCTSTETLLIISGIPLLISILYFAGLESSKKQATWGKQIMKIKVTDKTNNRISFGRALGRYFAKILSGLILMIGFLMASWTDKNQALHDMIADTFVITNE